MRCLVTITTLLLTISCKAQRLFQEKENGLAVGMSGGYSNKNCTIGNISLGAQLPDRNHLSFNLVILGKLLDGDIPAIGEVRIGHQFGPLELYGGYGYHYAGHDANGMYNANINGWKPAWGCIFRVPDTPFTISPSISGKIFSIQVGIFAIR